MDTISESAAPGTKFFRRQGLDGLAAGICHSVLAGRKILPTKVAIRNSQVEASSLLFNEAKISAKTAYTIFVKLFYFLYYFFINQLKLY